MTLIKDLEEMEAKALTQTMWDNHELFDNELAVVVRIIELLGIIVTEKYVKEAKP